MQKKKKKSRSPPPSSVVRQSCLQSWQRASESVALATDGIDLIISIGLMVAVGGSWFCLGSENELGGNSPAAGIFC